MTRFTRLALAAALVAGVAAPAFATPVVIQNPYVKAGVSDYGTLGSNGGTPPGILFDPTGTSNYGNNDFLTPGDPFEGFYITSSAGGAGANNDGNNGFGLGSPTALSPTSASWTGTSGAYTVTNTYTLTTANARSEIAIHTSITNTSGADISGLQFLRTLDPDPDVNNFGSYFTNNTVVNPSTACGTGPDSGQTICITTADNDFAHLAGVSASWSQTPADYLAGLNDGNGDYAIGLAFDIGNLAAGQTVSLDYSYAAGASISVVTVPEPANVALMLAGLGLVGFVARRRRV
ncbi:MAG TPA: PEP-CTERM sorting domain-containing protein [Burkholderiaceae bacterium]